MHIVIRVSAKKACARVYKCTKCNGIGFVCQNLSRRSTYRGTPRTTEMQGKKVHHIIITLLIDCTTSGTPTSLAHDATASAAGEETGSALCRLQPPYPRRNPGPKRSRSAFSRIHTNNPSNTTYAPYICMCTQKTTRNVHQGRVSGRKNETA